jgi:hypothetical protein
MRTDRRRNSSQPENLRTKAEKQRSVFLNFQKHLVTTLRTRIRMKKNLKNDPTVYLAHKMWSIFERSTYYSKRVLFFLFGVKWQSEHSKSSKLDVCDEYTQISTLYPAEEIALAQEYLRDEILRQSRELVRRNEFQNRRFKLKEEFKIYFGRFLDELEEGWISRRFPKSTKMMEGAQKE